MGHDERLEPAVVEGGREDEGDGGDARPHQPAREGRSRLERGRSALDAVRVGHDEPDRDQQGGVRRELEVERAPGGADGLGSPVGDAGRLGSDDAHQSFE